MSRNSGTYLSGPDQEAQSLTFQFDLLYLHINITYLLHSPPKLQGIEKVTLPPYKI